MTETRDLNETYPLAGTFQFGDTAEMCQSQLRQVRAGEMTANCGSLAEFGDDIDSLPTAGRCDIAANWDGTPALVIKTIEVQQLRYCDVTEEMAQACAMPTLLAWRKVNKSMFKRMGDFDPEMIVVFERFEMIEDLHGLALETDT